MAPGPTQQQQSVSAQALSPRSGSGGSSSSSTPLRPALSKRGSSQTQVQLSTRAIIRSPGASELDAQPLRHAVRSKGHARIVLPRNHSSGRNLAKLARQTAAAAGEYEQRPGKLHTRQRSHEGDTEIRLPGSLDESESRPPPIRRNLTAYHLPRNASHTKLKKNLSPGHLQRLGSTKDLVALSSAKQKPPPSPGLKGRSKRPKSVDWLGEKDLHEQEVELGLQREQDRRRGQPKVDFDVGHDSDQEQVPHMMEGSGLDEGEWTEDSASVSPYSTRQNTASNSRRASVAHDRQPERSSLSTVSFAKIEPVQQRQDVPTVQHEASNHDGSEAETVVEAEDEVETGLETGNSPTTTSDEYARTSDQHTEATSTQAPQVQRSPLHAAKDHPNPMAHLLRRNSNQLPAPALVSNISVMDDARSARTSPAPSLRSTTMLAEQDTDELVSRFVPSTSNGSGTTSTMPITPKSSSFQNNDDEYHDHHRRGFSLGPVSPGSTVSGSSGAATPAMGRSRIELKMLQQKAIADMESDAEKGPIVPAHVYDRRNESLKSYLQLAALQQQAGSIAASKIPISLGPEIFQGRFKAVNTELRVVQKFRNPIAESVARLRVCDGSELHQRSAHKQTANLRPSKSAVNLPVRPKKGNEMRSAPSSPPSEAANSAKSGLVTSKSSSTMKPTRRTASRGVSFAGIQERRDNDRDDGNPSLDDLARELWDSVLA